MLHNKSDVRRGRFVLAASCPGRSAAPGRI